MELLATDTVHTRNNSWLNIFLYLQDGKYLFIQNNPLIDEEFCVYYVIEEDALAAYDAVLANNFLSQFEEA